MKTPCAEVVKHYGLTLADVNSEDRALTKNGLRRVLIAAYYQQQAKMGREWPEWELIWNANRWAYREAFWTWGKRLPKRLSDFDRSRVAWILSQEFRFTGGYALTGDRAKAWKWSRV